jgi:hypothetical protein
LKMMIRRAGPDCAICGEPHPNPDFAVNFPGLLCRACDARAVGPDGRPPWVDEGSYDPETNVLTLSADIGENPVFVDGIKCWRQYKFGGWVTMRDYHDCDDFGEFYERHMPGPL